MTDAALMLRELAEPSPRGDRIKQVIERSARLAGLSYWRAFDLWYGKARRIEQFEIEQIQEAIHKKRKEDARREIQDLRNRLTRLESMLVLSDAEFHREAIDAVRISHGGHGRVDSPVDKGEVK